MTNIVKKENQLQYSLTDLLEHLDRHFIPERTKDHSKADFFDLK